MAYPTIRCGTCLTVLAANPDAPLDVPARCPVCGGMTRNYAITIASAIRVSEPYGEALATISPEHVMVDPRPTVDGEQTRRLRGAGYRLEWSELTETGAWWVRVFRGDKLVDSAAGFEPRAVLLAVSATLLPPHGE